MSDAEKRLNEFFAREYKDPGHLTTDDYLAWEEVKAELARLMEENEQLRSENDEIVGECVLLEKDYLERQDEINDIRRHGHD